MFTVCNTFLDLLVFIKHFMCKSFFCFYENKVMLDDLQYYSSFNSSSIILSQWQDDIECICTYVVNKNLPPARFQPRPVA